MTAALFDEVVLTKDIPSEGLKSGDLGTVVHVYEQPEGLEVEFFTASGKTRAVVTLTTADVRPVSDNEIVAVRPLGATG